jgi:hypothetical protein
MRFNCAGVREAAPPKRGDAASSVLNSISTERVAGNQNQNDRGPARDPFGERYVSPDNIDRERAFT